MKDYTMNPDGCGYATIGGTSKFAMVQIKDKFYLEDLEKSEDGSVRLPLAKELVNLYTNQLYKYLDQDPDNQEDERIYNEVLFNGMCKAYFLEDLLEKQTLEKI